MSISATETDRLCLVLKSATDTGELKWSRQPPSFLNRASATRINGLYVTWYEDSQFALMETAVRQYDPDNDSFFMSEGLEFALLDAEQRVAYAFPYADGMQQLLRSVKAQTSEVESVVAKILKQKRKPGQG